MQNLDIYFDKDSAVEVLLQFALMLRKQEINFGTFHVLYHHGALISRFGYADFTSEEQKLFRTLFQEMRKFSYGAELLDSDLIHAALLGHYVDGELRKITVLTCENKTHFEKCLRYAHWCYRQCLQAYSHVDRLSLPMKLGEILFFDQRTGSLQGHLVLSDEFPEPDDEAEAK